MNPERLRTFLAVARALHFRRAAQELQLSQSAVSQQIAALERELGAALFERIGRRVHLTTLGEGLVVEAVKVLAAIERAREQLALLGRGNTGRLRIGASTTPGIYLLPDVLGRFRADMPGIVLDLRIANSSAVEAALIENQLDIGVIGEAIAHAELFQVALGRDRVVAVVAPALARKGTRSLRPAELGGFALLARESGSATRRFVDDALRALGVELTPSFELPSPEAQLRAAAAGLGIAFVSRHAAAHDLTARRLVELRISGLDLVRPISAVYHRDKRVTPAMRDLLDLLQDRLRRDR